MDGYEHEGAMGRMEYGHVVLIEFDEIGYTMAEHREELSNVRADTISLSSSGTARRCFPSPRSGGEGDRHV